jgi:hypothetical protein
MFMFLKVCYKSAKELIDAGCGKCRLSRKRISGDPTEFTKQTIWTAPKT